MMFNFAGEPNLESVVDQNKVQERRHWTCPSGKLPHESFVEEIMRVLWRRSNSLGKNQDLIGVLMARI